MTSPTSFCKPVKLSQALLGVNFKRFIWLPLLNLLGMLLFLPFIILSSGPGQAQRILENKAQLQSWGGLNWFDQLCYSNPMLTFMLIASALLWAALLYSYLNEGKAVTMFHSLPFSRSQLYWNLNLAGVVGLLLPVLITSLCCLMLRYFGSIGILYSAGDVLRWALGYYIMELVMFASAVFTGMFTGMPLVQTILTLILHGLPAALYGLTALILHEGIYGFPNYADRMDWLEYLPIIKMFDLRNENYAWIYLLIMVLLTAAFLWAGMAVYRRRPLERTGDIMVFPALNPIFKYGVTYCACLSGALMTAALINETMDWWMLLLWAIVGYCLAEMLIQKSIRIIKAWRGLLAASLILMAMVAGVRMDLTGYQRRLPQADQVAAVIVNGDEEKYAGLQALEKLEFQGGRIQPQLLNLIDPKLCFQEEGSIEALLQIHGQLIERRSKEAMEKYRNNELTYIMKDGRVLRRQYSFSLTDYPEQAKALFESEEYRSNRQSIPFASAKDLLWLKLGNGGRQGAETEVIGAEVIEGLLAAVRKDIEEETFESMEAAKGNFYSLRYRYAMPDLDWEALQTLDSGVFDERMKERIADFYGAEENEKNTDPYKSSLYDRYDEFPIPGNYVHTLAWIQSNGYETRLMPEADAFQEVRLYKDYNFSGYDLDKKYYEYRGEAAAYAATEEGWTVRDGDAILKAKPPIASLTDPALIGHILEDDTYDPYFLPFGEKIQEKEVYRLEFINKDGNPAFSGYYYQGLPAFLKDAAGNES